MPIARTHSVSLLGLRGAVVEIEADLSNQLPNFVLIGLPDTALGEAKDRVRAAIGNAGLELPSRRLTVNLSPAALPKHGSGFDLGIALAVLACAEAVSAESIDRVVHLGELGLDGRLRPIDGVLPAVLAAQRAGFATVMVPSGNADEAALVPGIRVVAVPSLREAAIWHGGSVEPEPVEPILRPTEELPWSDLDLADVIGNADAIDALIAAAAGGHHVFMLGPPGAGKTMLAARLPGLLPELDAERALEVSSVRSLSGLPVGTALATRPPFEAPHHSASTAALIGGGSGFIRPGAAARAAHGVLFLDEAPEFPSTVLDALRQPLESGVITIHRARSVAHFPGSFQLVHVYVLCDVSAYGGPVRVDRKRWSVWFTTRARSPLAPELQQTSLESWLDSFGVQEGSPFILGPNAEFDVDLNSFFQSPRARSYSLNTQEAYARDVASLLSFLDVADPGFGGWRAVQSRHIALYFHWRNLDPAGPRIAASTWNREISTLSAFYAWARWAGLVQNTPVVRATNSGRGQRLYNLRSSPETRTRRPDGASRDVEWIAPTTYRLWRDVGVRGFQPSGIRDRKAVRGQSGRDSVYTDMMITTGMRLGEQSSLLMGDIPCRNPEKRFIAGRIPNSIAKNQSGRPIYYPSSVLTSVEAYVQSDRRAAVAAGRSAGRYDARYRAFTVDVVDPKYAITRGGARVSVDRLTVKERRQLFRETEVGWEPESLWLSRVGEPLAPGAWQQAFDRANARTARQGLSIRVHPHLLRHSYAVITLEQLQRALLAALASNNPAYRAQYQRVFGDPVDTLRRRLGHRSIESTYVYLHALEELEMETKLQLIDSEWHSGDLDSLGQA